MYFVFYYPIVPNMAYCGVAYAGGAEYPYCGNSPTDLILSPPATPVDLAAYSMVDWPGPGLPSNAPAPAPAGGASTSTTPACIDFVSVVSAILRTSAAPGHTLAGDGNFILDPTDSALYDRLLNTVPSCGLSACPKYVVPGSPSTSLIWNKLNSATPACGAQMPYGGVYGQPWVATITSWITSGAIYNCSATTSGTTDTLPSRAGGTSTSTGTSTNTGTSASTSTGTSPGTSATVALSGCDNCVCRSTTPYCDGSSVCSNNQCVAARATSLHLF